MTHKHFALMSSIVFGLVAVMHALRLLNGWHAEIGGFVVPMWYSVAGLLLAGYLAYQGYRLKK